MCRKRSIRVFGEDAEVEASSRRVVGECGNRNGVVNSVVCSRLGAPARWVDWPKRFSGV
jgi:hypothetical protein